MADHPHTRTNPLEGSGILTVLHLLTVRRTYSLLYYLNILAWNVHNVKDFFAGAEIFSAPFLYFFVHGGGIIFTDIIRNDQNLHSHGACAHGNFNAVAHFYIIACFYNTAVDTDPAIIAGFVGDSPALDEPGDLQILIQPHITWKRRPSEPCWP